MRDPRDNWNRNGGGMMNSPAWRSGLEYAAWLYETDPEYRARIDREEEEARQKREQDTKQDPQQEEKP
jgi:hypothetical protein